MSGLIPQPFIDDLLQRTDLVEFIDAYVPLKKRGNSYLACCPFHNEKSPSFNVVARKQFYHCFGCGVSGNAISFAMNYLNQGFIEAVDTLASRLGLVVPREGQQDKKAPSMGWYQLLTKVSTYYQKQLRAQGVLAVEYLRKRGLNGEIAKKYQLGFAPEGWHGLERAFPRNRSELIATGMLVTSDEGKVYDRYRNRVMFPIQDRQGRIIGFGGRVLLADQKPKYLNSPETSLFQKGRELYGLYQVITEHKSLDCIVVVEGYLDVIALAQHGFTKAVATLGTATTAFHMQLLSKYTNKVIFCFDGDAAGKQAAWRALESTLPHVNTGLEAGFVFLPEEHDPDSLVRKEGKEFFLKCLEQAIPLHQWLFDTLTKNLNLQSPSGVTQLFNQMKSILQKVPEGSFKEIVLDYLARLTHIDPHRVQQLLTEGVVGAPKIKEQIASIARSPLRIAVALLLQHPEIYAACSGAIDPSLLNEQDHEILIQLLYQLIRNPKVTTAILIESFRASSYFDALNKLAVWEHQVPEQELNKEFIDTMLFLQKQSKELRIQALIHKARTLGLSAPEKILLQKLLQERHKTLQ